MRFFALSAFATLAFGLFASAAPTPNNFARSGLSARGADIDIDVLRRGVEVDTDLLKRDGGLLDVEVDVDVDVPKKHDSLKDVDVPKRGSKTLETILNDLLCDLNPILEKIKLLKVVDATLEVVTSLLEEVLALLKGAIKDVECLLDGVLELTCDLKGLAALIASVLRVVICILDAVLCLVTAAIKTEILPLVAKIGALLGDLLCVILKLVGGILEGLVKEIACLLADLLSIIFKVDLNLKVVIKVLCLKLVV